MDIWDLEDFIRRLCIKIFERENNDFWIERNINEIETNTPEENISLLFEIVKSIRINYFSKNDERFFEECWVDIVYSLYDRQEEIRNTNINEKIKKIDDITGQKQKDTLCCMLCYSKKI